MREIMLSVRALTKKYGNFTAVDKISFDVKRAEIFGLLGPNGSGKSTLIKMLTGFLKPSSGDAEINRISIRQADRIKPLIGWAPQEDSFYTQLTVRENLLYFGSLYGITGSYALQRADEIMDMLNLNEKKDTVSAYLSGGMKKRLNIGLAIFHSPKILFLDEPTVGVDPISRKDLWNIIDKIKSQEVTILYTTHYLPEVERLCDRVALIQDGRLIRIDTPANLKREYGPTIEDAFMKLVGEK